jgi:hypothetical protein
MTFIYPTNAELNTIQPALTARMAAQRVGFDIMPMRSVNAATIEWEQRDNYRGLQQLRGLDGAPTHVKPIGTNRYSYEPGVYGEFQTITETELTKRRGAAAMNVPIAVDDLVAERQEQLTVRELDRMEQIVWTLLTTGTFSIALPGGAVGFTDTFALQTYSRITAWHTTGSAVPTQDWRAVGLLGRGKGVNFGGGANAYMNKATANDLLNNTVTTDLFGRRVGGGNTLNSINDLNRFQADLDLPTINVYDEGYYDDSNTWTLFIPNNKVVVVGKRPAGQKIGEYVKTRNMVNPDGAPGSYFFVKDRTGNAPDGSRQVPPNMEVHAGHNGGPVIYYPGSIVVMTV